MHLLAVPWRPSVARLWGKLHFIVTSRPPNEAGVAGCVLDVCVLPALKASYQAGILMCAILQSPEDSDTNI